jgi:hypothetical protein
MDKKLRSQKGQALVLIAVGMVALIAMTGLAIDGGNVFSDRRHAQNAADTAALSAALLKVTNQPWYQAALDLASINAYPNDGVKSTVTAQIPPGLGCNGQNGPYAGNNDYVQVIIHSSVDTFFAQVIGINQMHNCVEAIAQATPSVRKPWASGNSIAAMACHGKWILNFTGSSNTITANGGVFSNSDHNHSANVHSNDTLTIEPPFGVSSVGVNPGIDAPSSWPPPPLYPGVEQIPCPDYPPFNLPNYMYPVWDETLCDITEHDFPDDFNLLTTEEGVEVNRMETGKTYCITGSFKYPNQYPLLGDSVHIVLINGDNPGDAGMTVNGGAELHLSAGQGGIDPLNGILIYVPKPNVGDITINGTADSEITGSIFAPNSNIKLTGDFSGSSYQAQIIGATVDLNGASNLYINYDKGLNGGYTEPARIELSK